MLGACMDGGAACIDDGAVFMDDGAACMDGRAGALPAGRKFACCTDGRCRFGFDMFSSLAPSSNDSNKWSKSEMEQVSPPVCPSVCPFVC